MKNPKEIAELTVQAMQNETDCNRKPLAQHITEAIYTFINQGPTRVDFADWIKKNAHQIDGVWVLNRNPGSPVTSNELNHVFTLECFGK